MSEDILLSIIVPVYNTPIEHLNRCFDSLKNQTCKEFELIVIDDGSEEEVANYIEGLTSIFEHIITEHIEHTGVSAARNKGLSLVNTPFVAFSDSDDEYSLTFVEEAKEYLVKYRPDIIFGVVSLIPYGNMKQTDGEVHFCEGEEDIREVYKAFCGVKKNKMHFQVCVSQCARIYSSQLAGLVKYDEGVHFAEDQIFNRKCIKQANKVLLVPNVWYRYYSNKYSSTHREVDSCLERERAYLDAFVEMNKYEDDEMLRNLWVMQISELRTIIRYEFLDYPHRIGKILARRKISDIKAILDETLAHPYFSTAFLGLKGSREIDVIDRVMVCLVNHRMYVTLVLLFRIGRIFKRCIRLIMRQSSF